MLIPLSDEILPNPEQPRKTFTKDALMELADSIRIHGVLQPIRVEQVAEHRFILEDGERRVRAARIAGLKEIPAILVDAHPDRQTRLEHALIANIQRSDLTPIEEAKAFRRLMDDYGLTMTETAERLGIKYHRLTNRLKLLTLEEPIQKMIDAGDFPKDDRAVNALLDVPAAKRVELARNLANRNITIKAIVEACGRVTAALNVEKVDDTEAPAIRHAVRASGDVRRTIWDAYADAGKLPAWTFLQSATRNTCERCSMRPTASHATCKGCAMVDVLAELLRMTNGSQP